MRFEEIIENLGNTKVHGYTWNKKNILEKYEGSKNINSFLGWSIDTAGPWVLIDPAERIIVTSPGWPGGYIDFETLMVSTKVQPLLSRRNEQGKKLLHGPAARRYLSPDNPNGVYSFPCQSPFSGIRILGGGCLVQYGIGVVSSYLGRASSFGESDRLSFEDAMLETASRCTDPVKLMFSGGKDSLAIYLALEEASSEEVSATYVRQDGLVSGGQFSQARHIASEYGFPLNVVEPEGGWAFGDSATWGRLDDLLSTTLVNPVAPDHAVSQEPKRLLVSGQNMDAMLSMDMPKPPQSYPSLRKIRWWARHIISYLPKSIRYTDPFFRSKTFRRIVRVTEKAVKQGLSKAGWATMEETPPLRDTSFRGILKSLITKELPGSAKPDSKLYIEAKKIEKTIGQKNVQEGWFHMYPRLSALMGSAGRYMQIFANQGTMYDIWERGIKIRSSVEPKKELRNLLNKLGEEKYSSAMSGVNEKDKVASPNLSVLRKYEDLFIPTGSALVELANHDLKRRLIKKLPELKSSVFGVIEQSEQGGPIDNLFVSRAFRYINLELLVRESGA